MPFLSSSPQPQRIQVHQHVQPQRKPSVFAQFNYHAQGCSRCKKPLEVVRRGEQLCDIGHKIATDVAKALYKIGGEAASQYEPSGEHWLKLNVDITHLDGPVYELVQAMGHGLAKRSPPMEGPGHYTRPAPVSRHERDSSPKYYTTSSASSSTSSHRRDQIPRSGNIKISVPVEYGHEASYYKELQQTLKYSNGSTITPAYYYPDHSSSRPQLKRSNSYREPSSSKPARRSTVQFNPEVKYYP